MSLRGYKPYPPALRRRRGIGVTALVLGILAVPMLVLCGIGLVVALAGLVVGGIAVSRRNGRALAITGITISSLALIGGGVGASWFLTQARECANATKYPDADARELCVQKRFPFIKATRTPGGLTPADPLLTPATPAVPPLPPAGPSMTPADPAMPSADPAMPSADPSGSTADSSVPSADPAVSPAESP